MNSTTIATLLLHMAAQWNPWLLWWWPNNEKKESQ